MTAKEEAEIRDTERRVLAWANSVGVVITGLDVTSGLVPDPEYGFGNYSVVTATFMVDDVPFTATPYKHSVWVKIPGAGYAGDPADCGSDRKSLDKAVTQYYRTH